MKKRKLIATLLFMSIGMSAFTGCNTKKGGSEVAGQADVGQEGTVQIASPSWKTDTSPYTIDWFVSYDWYSKKFNPDTNLTDKKILTDTGITLNITTGDFDKLNMMIATGDLPDVITTDATASQRLLLENGGMLLDLNELSAKYAPDLNVPQSMKDWYTAEDGNWYAITSFYYGPERTSKEFGGYYETHNKNFVRTDLLEQTGYTLEDMKTKEGFLNACRAIKEKGITYNGMSVTPFMGADAYYLGQQFGMDLEDKEGNLLNPIRQPEYLEALLFLNTMYREGLFTDEEFTMDKQQKEQMVASGRVFAANTWTTVSETRKALSAADPNARILYAGVMEGDQGKKAYIECINAMGWTGTLITKNAKRPDRIIQFMSYMTSEEATLDQKYGVGTYDIVDGKVVQKPEVKKEFDENYQVAKEKYMGDFGYFTDWTIIQKYLKTDTNDIYEVDQYKSSMDPTLTLFDNKCFRDIKPEAGTDMAAKKARIDEYWGQCAPKIVMASSAAECEKLYNEAIKGMEDLGLKELETYQNERFQKNKEKMGIKFAWPRNQ